MICKDSGELVHAYVDDELDIVTARELDTHLTTCEQCRRVFETAKAVKDAVGNPSVRFSAPADLRHRIFPMSGNESLPSSGRRTPNPARYWLPLALAAALLIVSGLYLSTQNRGGRPQFALEQELLDSHIRSLQEPEESHLFDVKSTDQHTVKPWFDGHVDFSPPVKQFAADGFPLMGGRLDYLNGHPVAALVYGHAKHRINLFVWPKETGESRSVGRGFNLFHWSDRGMTFWAVSDVDPQQLEIFENLVRSTAPTSAATR